MIRAAGALAFALLLPLASSRGLTLSKIPLPPTGSTPELETLYRQSQELEAEWVEAKQGLAKAQGLAARFRELSRTFEVQTRWLSSLKDLYRAAKKQRHHMRGREPLDEESALFQSRLRSTVSGTYENATRRVFARRPDSGADLKSQMAFFILGLDLAGDALEERLESLRLLFQSFEAPRASGGPDRPGHGIGRASFGREVPGFVSGLEDPSLGGDF